MLLELVAAGILCAAAGPSASSHPTTGVIPRPQIEIATGRTAVIARQTKRVRIAVRGAKDGPIREGLRLLARRLESLGYESCEAEAAAADVAIETIPPAEMEAILARHGVRERLAPARLRQSYRLFVDAKDGAEPVVQLRASGGGGLYYGVVTLCQLLGTDASGRLCAAGVEIVDYPAIAHRLAKLSASGTPPESIARFAGWLCLSKLSQIGLQYHGDNSKDPGGYFRENVTRFCPWFRRTGTLESIVYFCPFRQSRDSRAAGEGAYDFRSPDDRAAYERYILWILGQGAHGIEVDYNDWPDKTDVPIADVLNLVCRAIEKARPDAYVLYCPPAKGRESYRGPATPELRRTLSLVPARVWPLWTGPATLIETPLGADVVEQWTRDAGRRPFLWVNRVRSDGNRQPFCRRLPGPDGGPVFRGEFLPRDLDRLFEGVHLNATPPPDNPNASAEAESEAIAYLLTAADFLWNPRDWDAADSCRRARRFADIIKSLGAIGPQTPDAADSQPSRTDR
ncbi:MAG: glycoside hydrolase family 20 zincin-like fold domain-containing protein [Phycisphaerae bacterium]